MTEDTPVSTQLARIMATDETSSPRDFRLSFNILNENVVNERNPKRHALAIQDQEVESKREQELRGRYFDVRAFTVSVLGLICVPLS